VSKGRKSFSLQQMGTGNGGWIPGSANIPTAWNTNLGVSNYIIYASQELDLRAYNQGGKGLQLLQLAIQESGPWMSTSSESPINEPPYLFCVDVLSSVALTQNSIAACNPDVGTGGQRYHFFPGFLGDESAFATGTQELNSTQVLWGLWRRFNENANIPVNMSSRHNALTLTDSGEWGSAEVAVAPSLFWTRIVWVYEDHMTVYAPSSILEMVGDTLDLPQYVELNQMARMGQR
jgi:hypothetical protein